MMTDLTAQIEGSRQHEEAVRVAREEAVAAPRTEVILHQCGHTQQHHYTGGNEMREMLCADICDYCLGSLWVFGARKYHLNVTAEGRVVRGPDAGPAAD